MQLLFVKVGKTNLVPSLPTHIPTSLDLEEQQEFDQNGKQVSPLQTPSPLSPTLELKSLTVDELTDADTDSASGQS